VDVLSTDQESEDPFDLALRIQQRHRKYEERSLLYGADQESDLDSELQLLDKYEHAISHEETKAQAPHGDYGMVELAKLRQQIELLD